MQAENIELLVQKDQFGLNFDEMIASMVEAL